MIMKRFLYHIVVLAIPMLAVACTKTSSSAAAGQQEEGRVTVFTVIPPFDEDQYEWSTYECVGVYGSLEGSNEPWVCQDGGSRMCGSAVRGDVFAYWPWRREPSSALAEGRMPLDEIQLYGTDPVRQLRAHCVAGGWLDTGGTVLLDYLAGILELSLPVEVDGLVTKVLITSFSHDLSGNLYEQDGKIKVSDGNRTVTVRAIGRPCRKSSPLKVYAVLPEGVLDDLQATIYSDKGTVISKPLAGSCRLQRGQVVKAVIDEDKILDFENGDLIYEEGQFD